MSTSLRFVVVGTGQQLIACADRLLARGHQILGVVSDCPEVSAWSGHRAIRRADHPNTAEWLTTTVYDYLLSIVNHNLLSPAVLATPGLGAINYHDSLLPTYAGFNATSWSIIDGQAVHGVTWHEMTADADRGPILAQVEIPIGTDDTAFSLGVKCSEAGVASFARLLEQLESGTLERRPQTGTGSFHHRSDRPGLALLDFSRPAAELHALIRGLNLGSDDNWMATPKVALPGGFLTVGDARVSGDRSAPPGTIVGITQGALAVATGRETLAITEFLTLDGDRIDPIQVATQFGLAEGSVLPSIASAWTDDSARGFDAAVTKFERFWVRRLADPRPATHPALSPQPSAGSATVHRTNWSAALLGLPEEQRGPVLVAAFAACLHRLSGAPILDFAVPAQVPEPLRSFYAPTNPFRCEFAEDLTLIGLADQVRAEIGRHSTRLAVARDNVQRYRERRAQGRSREPLSIGVRFELPPAGLEAALTDGAQLALVVTADGPSWVFDGRAISAAAVAELARRVDVIASAGLAAPKEPMHALSVLLDHEERLLLDEWQRTTRPYEGDLCVHQAFERQVERTPEATAVVFGDKRLSYRELNQRANQVALSLRKSGVGPETLVAICVERSLDMMVGLLGILKAGGAYVPLDPAYPRERLGMMLEDSKARFLVAQSHLVSRLPAGTLDVLLADRMGGELTQLDNPSSGVRSDNLAYVIFTSGSTGRPKGTMLEHRNVVNFFAGMDEALGGGSPTPGVWLAVTSISFDISVLELFWTLARGFEVIIAPESDRASLERKGRGSAPRGGKPVDFGLFYFAADSGAARTGDAYRLLIEGAKFADTHGFSTVWTPERHFHAFGGLYPNPAVTTAALATITKRIHLRAGSVVLPLHNPLRVAEDWAVIDQLSGGRIGLSFASGWHVNDFAFMPDNYERRREVMLEHIATIQKLWRGEKVSVTNGAGQTIEVGVLPRPLQENPPLWIAAAGSPDTFALAGRIGANILTNMLGQDLADLKQKFAAYREARREHGHPGEGNISVMLHTFVCGDTDEAKRLARKPFSAYLASSFDLVKVAPKMFPAFRQPSREAREHGSIDSSNFSAEDMAALLDHAFDRYFDTAGLFGTPERALEVVDQLAEIGATEMACLVDFGIDPEAVLASLPHLHRLQELCRERAGGGSPVRRDAEPPQESLATLIRRHRVTHLQCTPSMARTLAADPESLRSLAQLERLMLGGEALPPELATQMAGAVAGQVLNMYGPTETTIWSTTSRIKVGESPTIGRPIANTTVRILDARGRLMPIGVPGELFLGGEGVARGYLDRPDLTAERFVPDPYAPSGRLYRTGDLARYRADGEIEFLGRLDHQVKINGYRIELGDIETALASHPMVRQSVVVAKSSNGAGSAPALVAYVVPARSKKAGTDTERVTSWQRLWDEAYRNGGPSDQTADPRFRIAGWNDSYTGSPIPAAEMREWLEATVERVLALKPRRVLEIGCGTGMILYRVAPKVDHYTGVDISAEGLESIRNELTPAEAAKVSLLHRAAHELDHLAERSFDLVIINSVAQYFPDADYLTRVLKRATDLIADGGHVLVGDVRSLPHLPSFHTSIGLRLASPSISRADLRQQVAQRVAFESELVLSEGFFRTLAVDIPRLGKVSIQLKRGRARNELTRFRYDAILEVGPGSSARAAAPATAKAAATLEEIRTHLDATLESVYVADLPNARLTGLVEAAHDLAERPDVAGSIDDLRALEESNRGIDPEDLFGLDPRYQVEVRWASSGDPSRFDALFRPVESTGRDGAEWPEPVFTAKPADYANTPGGTGDTAQVGKALRAHLEARLPEYMVPASFVVLNELPLTPNGKIDRKALPDPQREAGPGATAFAPPSNLLEQQISGVWQELLSIERVGRHDNIFDLGANSLITMQANNRLSAVLERKVSLVSMFRFPTVAALAAHLAESDTPGGPVVDQRAVERQSRSDQAAQRRRALRAGRTEP